MVFRFVNYGTIDRYEDVKWGVVRGLDDLVLLLDMVKINPKHAYEMILKQAELFFEPGEVSLNYITSINDLISISKFNLVC